MQHTHKFEWEKLTPHEVLVLIVLVSMVDEENHVKANLELLSHITRLTGSQIKHVLRSLDKKGVIFPTGKFAHEGLYTHTVYHIPEANN